MVSMLPKLVHVRGQDRLITLVELLNQETRGDRPGRETILARLLDVLLIEAIRSMTGPVAPPGLLRGLADPRLALALRQMHEAPTQAWTVARLAKAAGLSRSTFFERFRREVGVAPMEYLLAWRMALAKNLLRREGNGVAQVAARVGYGSASTFSVAFARHVGSPPMSYARRQRTEGSSLENRLAPDLAAGRLVRVLEDCRPTLPASSSAPLAGDKRSQRSAP